MWSRTQRGYAHQPHITTRPPGADKHLIYKPLIEGRKMKNSNNHRGNNNRRSKTGQPLTKQQRSCANGGCGKTHEQLGEPPTACFDDTMVPLAEGDYDGMIQKCNAALKLDGQNPGPYVHRGIARLCKEQDDTAIQDFRKALELNPECTLAWNNLAVAYANKGDFRKAIECLNEVIKVDPENSQAYLMRPQMHYRIGDYDKAIADLSKVIIELDPGNAEAHLGRGLTYMELGESDKAFADFRKVLALDPNNDCRLTEDVLARLGVQSIEDALKQMDACQQLGVPVGFWQPFSHTGQ
jgi:tetratricopeptide (TPR) repeat protein